MAITNVSKPSSSIANTTKINIGETWASISSTWGAETRTWNDLQSLIDNTSRAFGGLLWAASNLPWQMSRPWVDAGGISNVNRP